MHVVGDNDNARQLLCSAPTKAGSTQLYVLVGAIAGSGDLLPRLQLTCLHTCTTHNLHLISAGGITNWMVNGAMVNGVYD